MLKKLLYFAQIRYLLLAVVAILFLTGCQGDNSKLRAARAAKGKGDIVIGVVWSNQGKWINLGKGADLAVAQINAQPGGLLGRKVKIIKKDDQGSINRGLTLAEDFTDNLNIISVIGHIQSHISLPASPIYESGGVVMLTPGSTSTRLTKDGNPRLFRLIPSNAQIGQFLANYTQKQGYKRILIFYSRNEYGRDLANAFEKEVDKLGVEVVDRRSFVEQSGKYTYLFRYWRRHTDFDAIFLIASLPEGAEVLKQIRAAGVTVPVFSADALDGKDLINIAGKDAEGTAVISFLNPAYSSPAFQKFAKAYKAKYKQKPDTAALLGYDAIWLVAHAIKGANSTVPDKIAEYLKQMPEWEGATGIFSFDEQGNLTAQDRLHLKVVKDNKLK